MFAVVLAALVSTRSVVGEEMFPPWFDPMPTRKGQSAMVRPFSHVPSFGGHCCPGVSRPIPVDGGSSSSRSGSILPSLVSKLTHTSGDGSGVCGLGLQYCTVSTGVTVICAASRVRFSPYRLITASSSSGSFPLSPSTNYIVFCQGLVRAGIEIAFFKAFTLHHKSAANSPEVGGSERGP